MTSQAEAIASTIKTMEANILRLKKNLIRRLAALIVDCQFDKEQLENSLDDPTSRDLPLMTGVGGTSARDIIVSCSELVTQVQALAAITYIVGTPTKDGNLK